MKICLIGDFSSQRDESQRVTAFQLVERLGKNHRILKLHLWDFTKPAFWKSLKAFRPDIIHYIPGMSINSLALMKIISIYYRNAVTVVSATRPYFSNLSARAIPIFKPDLILTQSYDTEQKLESLGCETRFLSGGVDTDRFVPVRNGIKGKFREKYGIDKNSFIALHVGSVKPGRGILSLAGLQQQPDVQVVIVGPTSVGVDDKTKRQLETAGCIVLTDYFENIPEAYAIADCYVYPTVALKDNRGRDAADSAEMPLSVLEAMSCNLPVITTRFGALPRIFGEGDGLFFAEQADIADCLKKVRIGETEINTRERVLPYSWDSITGNLESIYRWLLWQRAMKRRSTLICITGMDGAGKTTLARSLSYAVGENGLKSRYVHSRLKPFISRLPMQIGMALFLRGKDKHRSYGEYAGRKKRLFKNRLLSWIYSSLLSIDYFFQVLFKITIPLMCGRNIICDRYIYDTVILDLAIDLGYPPEKTMKVIRSWQSFLPRPDIVFLLDAPEETIFARKDDIPSLDYVREARDIFLAVSKDSGMILLDSSKPVEEVERAAIARVRDFLYHGASGKAAAGEGSVV